MGAHLKLACYPLHAWLLCAVTVVVFAGGTPAFAQPDAEIDVLRTAFQSRVTPRLVLPPDEVLRYAHLTQAMLDQSGTRMLTPQYVVVVDRSPLVQAVLLFWWGMQTPAALVGASLVSTGRVGQFDHFESPMGVFSHTLDNPDFRAEGTKNAQGFRGYGAKGLRVFDLGWQQAKRGWGKGGVSTMRLQMHATDPDLAEPKLGSVQSKGCLRISASLNRLLDQFGVLDADYEAAHATGPALWVLDAQRTPVTGAGRYVVVVDSQRSTRPGWVVLPTTSR